MKPGRRSGRVRPRVAAAELALLLDDEGALRELLLTRSGLPGPRANLELAAAVADAVAARGAERVPWPMLWRWAQLDSAQAPTHHPREYLPFVALQALGAAFRAAPETARARVGDELAHAATDPRWRIREAVAMALQRVGLGEPGVLQTLLTGWLEPRHPLRHRAIMAALADPPLLAEPAVAGWALGLADRVLSDFAAELPSPEVEPGVDPSRARRRVALSDDEGALLRALEYAPSVLVAAAPAEGFALLRRWAAHPRSEVGLLVAANLRKGRLARAFPDECEQVGEVLAASAGEL